MEFNSVNSVHSAGLPDGSKKLQRGDTGGDPNQMMLFASLIGPASAITPREAENNNLDAEYAKDVGGKSSIENVLKHSGLKGKENIVEHGKTGIKELTDYKIEVLQKEISSSTRLVDKISPVGEYHHTDFHTAGRTTAVNESVKNYGMEPRTLINQIVNGVSKTGRVKIVLTPPHLGTLDMEVLVKNNKVHIILQTENNNVKHILQSNVETLKSALRSQGLIADNINVFVQERSDSAGYSGFGRNETLFKEGNNQNKNGKDQGGRWDALDHTPSLFDEENPSVRVDGRISLFV